MTNFQKITLRPTQNAGAGVLLHDCKFFMKLTGIKGTSQCVLGFTFFVQMFALRSILLFNVPGYTKASVIFADIAIIFKRNFATLILTLFFRTAATG